MKVYSIKYGEEREEVLLTEHELKIIFSDFLSFQIPGQDILIQLIEMTEQEYKEAKFKYETAT